MYYMIFNWVRDWRWALAVILAVPLVGGCQGLGASGELDAAAFDPEAIESPRGDFATEATVSLVAQPGSRYPGLGPGSPTRAA